MDPVSIVAATVGLNDVAFRLGRFLKRTVEGAQEVDQDLVHLLSQVENLSSINNGITSITCAFDFAQTFRRSFRDTGTLAKPWEDLWRDTLRISKETTRLLLKLETVLKEIQGVEAVDGRLADKSAQKKPGESSVGVIISLRLCMLATVARSLQDAGRRSWQSISSLPTLC